MDLVTLALAKSYIDKRINEGEIVTGATPQQAAQIEQNKADIADLRTEVDELKESGGGSVDLTGIVRSVNGKTPDEKGNVEIDIPAMPEVPVTSVNGMTGDVVIDIPEQVQSDWNQNDITESDYIKNRTHWEEDIEIPVQEPVLEEEIWGQMPLTGSPGLFIGTFAPESVPLTVEPGVQYTVTVDGVEHQVVAKNVKLSLMTATCIGNLQILVDSGTSIHEEYSDTGEKWVYYTFDLGNTHSYFYTSIESESVTISVSKSSLRTVKSAVPLDEKFIPDSIARKTDIEQNVVQYIEQNLTEEQQMQTRANLGLYGSKFDTVWETVANGYVDNYGSGCEAWLNDVTFDWFPNGGLFRFNIGGTLYEAKSSRYTAPMSGVIYSWCGNLSLIPDSEGFVFTDDANSVDIPICIYTIDSSISVVARPDDGIGSFTPMSVEQSKGEQEVCSTIPEKYLPKVPAVADAAGDTPTAEEFNALLSALRDAGYLAT